MEKKYTREQRPQRGALSQAYRNEAIWSVQAYKLSFELVFQGRPYAKGHKHDLELLAARLNDLRRLQGLAPGAMTEARARELAAGDRHYVARPDRVGDGWHVWDSVSDHRVEFQEKSNG